MFSLDGAITILDTETMELRAVGGAPSLPLGFGDIASDGRELVVIRSTTDDDIWLLDL